MEKALIVIKENEGKQSASCNSFVLSKWKKTDKIFQLYRHPRSYFLLAPILIFMNSSD